MEHLNQADQRGPHPKVGHFVGWILVGTLLALSSCGNGSSARPSRNDSADKPTEHSDGGSGQEGAGGEKNSGGRLIETGGSEAQGGGGEPPSLRQLRSEQGAGCNVKNDCEAELSCIRGICQKADFGIETTGKECVQIDCEENRDCCGNLPTEIPDKCHRRASKCTQLLPGCSQRECDGASDCAGGGTCTGSCSVSTGRCTGMSDCLSNRCVQGSCSLDFTPCDGDADCEENVCTGGICDCENPSYDPTDPVCEDEDCEGLCNWACERSRCVIPSDCRENDDCFGAKPVCSAGTCVQCSRNADCSFGRICVAGKCETSCSADIECPLFESCKAGECVYVGCRSDRECTLIPSVEALGLPSGLDPRLLRCNGEDGVGRCIVPCQNDAQCPHQETCNGGVCEYIGCETDAECKSILGLFDQKKTEETPWVPIVECRSPKNGHENTGEETGNGKESNEDD